MLLLIQIKMANPKVVQNCAHLIPNVSHVIFDMDGLLLATEELYTEAANKVSEKFARNSPPKVVTWELKVKQMGLQKNDLATAKMTEEFVWGGLKIWKKC